MPLRCSHTTTEIQCDLFRYWASPAAPVMSCGDASDVESCGWTCSSPTTVCELGRFSQTEAIRSRSSETDREVDESLSPPSTNERISISSSSCNASPINHPALSRPSNSKFLSDCSTLQCIETADGHP